MRKKEDWMKVGTPVELSGKRHGTITSFSESKQGDITYVHSMYVVLNGRNNNFPINAYEIDPITTEVLLQ